MKTRIFLGIVIAFLLVSINYSCEKKDPPIGVILVTEKVDDEWIPVPDAYVEVGPPNQKKIVLDDVIDNGYTNSSGIIQFTFSRELVLRAIAYKYKRDKVNNIIYEDVIEIRDGDSVTVKKPIVLKTSYRTLVLTYNHTDSKTVQVE